MRKILTSILLFATFLYSCTSVSDKENVVIDSIVTSLSLDSLDYALEGSRADSFLANDTDFINGTLLNGRFNVDISQYDTFKREWCQPELLNKQDVLDNFEGVNSIGDLDKDGKNDFVFVLPSINRCEEGEAYYFSNPTIPRILTDSRCCHPYSIFTLGDIDEDSSAEIAEYYSSCSSRNKAITIWTLKKNRWHEVETFSYVINDEYEVFKDFGKLFKKVSKNQIRFLEITDINARGELVKDWKTVTVK